MVPETVATTMTLHMMINTQGGKAPRNNRSRQSAKAKVKTEGNRRSCRCCYKYLPIISGFILLILITGSITLIRGVLDCEGSPVSGCPSVVSLTRSRSQGSLISNRWVLTTRSCAGNSSFRYVCAGSPNATKYKIKRSYILDNQGEGIALLLLQTPVTFTDFQPILLPDIANQNETAQITCRVTGLSGTVRNQGEWREIASNERSITIHEAFPKL
ncbi:serine protease 30-like isoform X2 [Heptranchias perlo]|uniref:serine protease 30-like isoform X2 n=1 Tax=Heptranchias perlo TaxID=212740 RepID=UPI00355A924A